MQTPAKQTFSSVSVPSSPAFFRQRRVVFLSPSFSAFLQKLSGPKSLFFCSFSLFLSGVRQAASLPPHKELLRKHNRHPHTHNGHPRTLHFHIHRHNDHIRHENLHRTHHHTHHVRSRFPRNPENRRIWNPYFLQRPSFSVCLTPGQICCTPLLIAVTINQLIIANIFRTVFYPRISCHSV